MAVLHKNIRRFHLEGEIYDDSIIMRIKEEYILMLKSMMRCKGYLIRYDIDPDFSLQYNGKTFDFVLSVYGVFVGKKKAQCFDGIDKNALISNTTQKSKSEERSRHVA